MLVPKARFGSAGLTTTTSGNSSSEDSLDSYIPLFIPAGGADLLRDLKQTVAESTEGFWIGAFSFQRVLLKEEQQPEGAENGEGVPADPKITFDGKPSETLSEHTDLAKAFADEIYRKPEVRRVLKVVEGKSSCPAAYVWRPSASNTCFSSPVYRPGRAESRNQAARCLARL